MKARPAPCPPHWWTIGEEKDDKALGKCKRCPAVRMFRTTIDPDAVRKMEKRVYPSLWVALREEAKGTKEE